MNPTSRTVVAQTLLCSFVSVHCLKCAPRSAAPSAPAQHYLTRTETEEETSCRKALVEYELNDSDENLTSLFVCSEQTNKLATAWHLVKLYVARAHAHAVAQHVPDHSCPEGTEVPDRDDHYRWATLDACARFAKAKATEVRLRTTHSRIRIQLDPGMVLPTDTQITIDGAPLDRKQWDLSIPLDGGKHLIAVRSRGYKTWEQRFELPPRDADMSIKVPALEWLPPLHRNDGPTPVQWFGVALGGIGIPLLVAGADLTLLATRKKEDAYSDCVGEYCGTAGLPVRNQAKQDAKLATALWVLGGLSVTGGALLIYVGREEPKAPVTIRTAVSPASAETELEIALPGRW